MLREKTLGVDLTLLSYFLCLSVERIQKRVGFLHEPCFIYGFQNVLCQFPQLSVHHYLIQVGLKVLKCLEERSAGINILPLITC